MDKVYLLTYGTGDDGDEWGVVSIHMSRETAEAEREKDGWGVNVSGDKYSYDWGITEWDVVGVKSLDDKGYEQCGLGDVRGEQGVVVDKFHYHEMNDRLYVIVDMINTIIQQHPVYQREQRIQELVNDAVEKLVIAYQLAGGMCLRDE